jgi:HK97 gp10 family phage protein
VTFVMNPGAAAEIERIGERAVREALHDIAADMRTMAPVETGQLVNSIRVDETSGQVIAEADHAVYVEMGTEHMRAQPFMRPALFKRRQIRGGSA